jgi:hypothetical protein
MEEIAHSLVVQEMKKWGLKKEMELADVAEYVQRCMVYM